MLPSTFLPIVLLWSTIAGIPGAAASKDDLEARMAGDDLLDLSARQEKLSSLEIPVMIEIRLVGFDSEVHVGLPESLQRHLDASPSVSYTTLTALNSQLNKSSALPFVAHSLFTVSRARKKLSKKIQGAIKQQLSHESDTSKEAYVLDPAIVEEILQQDYKERSLSYTLYFIHFSEDLSPDKPYVFAPPVQTDSLFPSTRCGTIHGISSISGGRGGRAAGEEVQNIPRRFAWVALDAGPVAFGPLLEGDGIFNEYSIPRINNKLKNDINSLSAELVAAIDNANKVLFTPSLHHFPTPPVDIIEIVIIIITDEDDDNDNDNDNTNDKDNDGSTARDQAVLEWEWVKRELESLSDEHQTVSVNVDRLRFDECELCVSALTNALRTEIGDDTLDELRYLLDSFDMHDWLEHFDEIWKLRTHSQEMEGKSSRKFVAFVYDLTTKNPLLLDGNKQAMGFSDIVIGVQTQAEGAQTEYQCGGKTIELDLRDASRAVLGELLSSIWGVSSTTNVFDPHTKQARQELGWSVSRTPFGVISDSRELGFTQRDAVIRNFILSMIYERKTELADVLATLAAKGRQLEDIMQEEELNRFMGAWASFDNKVSRAVHFMSLLNFQRAISYVQQLEDDTAFMSDLVLSASERLILSLQCKLAKPVKFSLKNMLQTGSEMMFLMSCVLVCACVLFVPDSDIATRVTVYVSSLGGGKKKRT